MAADVWNAAREQGAEGQYVIGWYHSHPNLGAFFSGTDRHTQRSFFNHRHSVGLVVDPIRNERKFFMGPESYELPVEHTIQL
jgi:proteasome lid subunit RPN8/RPN11